MATTPLNSRFVRVVLDDTAKFLAALEELTAKSVFVGIPSTRIEREPAPGEKNPPNNAVIAASGFEFVAVAAGSSYTLTVSGGPLRVLLAPGNQTVASGHAVEFRTAVLSLPPLGYQWFFAETNSISGAMGPVLHLTDVQFSESGAYTVVVTNGFGAVTSSPALLRVVGVPPHDHDRSEYCARRQRSPANDQRWQCGLRSFCEHQPRAHLG